MNLTGNGRYESRREDEMRLSWAGTGPAPGCRFACLSYAVIRGAHNYARRV